MNKFAIGHTAPRRSALVCKIAAGTAAALLSFGAFAADADVLTAAQGAVDTAKSNGTTIALSLLGFSVAVWGIFAIIKLFGKR